jgi:NodT family efflux transporter outer membrane factor (OMF) lipoprotein
MRKFPASAVALACCLFLLGCEVGPHYHAPHLALPSGWFSKTPAKPDPAALERAELDRAWWRNFNDPVLEKLTALAAQGNFDLKIAEARISEARANRAQAQAGLLPTVNATGSALRQANRIAFPGEDGGSSPFNIKEPFNTFQAGFDATWELDLFGGTRRKMEAENARLDASVDTAEDMRIRLMAEVARTYIEIRHDQAQLRVIDETASADAKTVKLTQELYKAGKVARVDAIRADADLFGTEADIHKWKNLLAQSEFSLDLLLGANPGTTHDLIAEADSRKMPKGKTRDGIIPTATARPMLAAPATVIANRPDLRAAERSLAAATAEQGVATAALFPKVSLSGFLGLLNVESSKFASLKSKSWSDEASFTAPIFDFGKLRSQLHLAKAEKKEALFSYEKSVVAALSDVESSLSAYTQEEAHRHALRRVVDDDRRAASVALERYKQGTTNFLEVLDAQRSLYTAQNQVIDSDAQASEDLVALYKSLGGGWKVK